jgi:hypothetical protein
MLRAYISSLSLAIAALLFAPSLRPQLRAQSPPVPQTASAESLVVLRNGEVLRGTIGTAGDRFLLALPGREISLRRSDVDVVAHSLDEAYEQKRARTPPTSVEGRLDLAEWCLRHGLFAAVVDELATVQNIQPRHPRVKAIDERLQRALAAQTQSVDASVKPRPPAKPQPGEESTARLWPPADAARQAATSSGKNASSSEKTALSAAESAAILDRFMRTLPSTAVEDFTGTLQPMIVHGCATAGCHAAGNDTAFTLLRLPQGKAASRRLTQRNLYNTAQLVDFNRPADSRLLKVASQPHGPLAAGVFGDRRSPKYQQLVAWVAQLTGKSIGEPEGAGDAQIAAVENDSPKTATSARRKKSTARPSPDHFPGSAQPASFESLDAAQRGNQPAEIRQATGDSPKQPPRAAAKGRATSRDAASKEPKRSADHAKETGRERARNTWPPSAK